MKPEKETGVFLDGKSQIVEMMKLLGPQEKDRLISKVKIKNPALAQELDQSSITFAAIEHMKSEEIHTLGKLLNPQIIGVALRNMPANFQKKVLKNLDRASAVEAFNYMQNPLQNEEYYVNKSRKRMLEEAIRIQNKRKFYF